MVLCDGDDIHPHLLPLDKMSDMSPSFRLEDSGAIQSRGAGVDRAEAPSWQGVSAD